MQAESHVPVFLPWQQELARKWLSGQQDRFAHAWLIHGLAGIGKRQFALAAAASLLCETSENSLACGHCSACRWIASGNHPDVRRIRPDAIALEEGEGGEDDAQKAAAKKTPSKEIRVDQLRALSDWFNTATHRVGWRVAVIYPAQAMNAISANALLKVLEEPPEHTVFLLVADAPDRLLPTLVSRCRRLPLPTPSEQASLDWLGEQGVARASQWLSAAGGAPVLALKQAGTQDAPYPAWLDTLLEQAVSEQGIHVATMSDQLEAQDPSIWIDTLQRVMTDISLAASGVKVRYYPALQAKIEALAARSSPQALAQAGKWLTSQRAIASHPLNAKLFAQTFTQRMAVVLGQKA